jgi:divalent metal cation (Fe/Co/Zn/Cd) transporter
MANAVLLATLGLALILFSVQEFLDPNKRKYASWVIRALILGFTGMYLIYLYQEMSGSNTMGGAAAYPGAMPM